MRFKIDENLPEEFAELLGRAGYEADTVVSESLSGASDATIAATCRQEDRILVTLDLDFADIITYPPEDHPGLVVFRLARQEKPYVLRRLREVIPIMAEESPARRLWIVEDARIRVRGGPE